MASGNGLLVADVGKKMPVAVFYDKTSAVAPTSMAIHTHSVGLEPLHQDTVEEGNKSLDRLKSRLSSLMSTDDQFSGPRIPQALLPTIIK